jgi:ferredoxin-NADP reductase
MSATAQIQATNVSVSELEIELVISGREDLAQDVVALTFAHPDGHPLPGWTPGAHIDLILDASLTRQYSLCSSPADTSLWRIGVLRDPGSRGGSDFIHDRLHEGTSVLVRGPRNNFPLVSSPRYQFIAGGIGITPILPMIEFAQAAGAEWHLLYGGRRRDSMAFAGSLSSMGDQVAICPQDETGLLELASVLGAPRDDTVVYCCGPEALLGAVEKACSTWPSGALHIERFSAKPVVDEPSGAALETFEVVCQRSGVTVTVPTGKSVLDVIDQAGVSVLGSCYEGICGSCETAVLQGTPLHRDSVLTDEEREANDVMMICVSRSCSERLVLDL